MALRAELPLGCDEDFETVSAKLSELGGDLLVEALDRHAAGTLAFEEQGEEGCAHAGARGKTCAARARCR